MRSSDGESLVLHHARLKHVRALGGDESRRRRRASTAMGSKSPAMAGAGRWGGSAQTWPPTSNPPRVGSPAGLGPGDLWLARSRRPDLRAPGGSPTVGQWRERPPTGSPGPSARSPQTFAELQNKLARKHYSYRVRTIGIRLLKPQRASQQGTIQTV